MQSIYDRATLHALTARMDKLTPTTQAQWGQMNVAQMMAHCCAPVAVAVGDVTPRPNLISRILGPLVKNSVVGEKPFKQGLPTEKSFIVSDERHFYKEKERLVSLLTRMCAGGKDSMQGKRHPFFGRMTPDEWSTLIVKHTDHHLRQFGA